MMTEEEATIETKKLFGEDSFTEFDDAGGMDRYYVGTLPAEPGPYTGFMGFSWEEALRFANQADSGVARVAGNIWELFRDYAMDGGGMPTQEEVEQVIYKMLRGKRAGK